jgi:hypothetical protein
MAIQRMSDALVVAIAGLTDCSRATNDDVSFQRVSSTIAGIGLAANERAVLAEEGQFGSRFIKVFSINIEMTNLLNDLRRSQRCC